MTNELRDRIDGLINQNQWLTFLNTLDDISIDLVDNEGFDYIDVKEYLIEILNEKLGKY
jgi:hypothetical protein